MDRRYPRCGVAAATAAAAALALLTNVADVQGFAFQLPLPAKQAATAAATSQKRAFVGGGWGASARGVHASGAQGRTSTPTSRVARNTRHARTAVRYEEEDARLTKSTMASDESPTPSGAPTGGATAEEAIYLGGGGGKERKEEEKEEVEYAETEQSEKLRLTAEKLTLQAERLRLEVEKEQLMLQAAKVQDKEALERRQDMLIASLRGLHGRDEELTAAVKKDIKKIDADLFMRLADIAELASEVEERDSLVALSEDIMRALDTVDKGTALKVSRAIKESLDRVEEIEKATRARAAAQALVQAQNGSYGAGADGLTLGGGQEGSFDDMLKLGGMSSRNQDLRNLAGMGGAGSNSTVGADGMPGMPDVMNVMFLPLWVPTSLLKFVGSAPALLDGDIEAIKNEVFGMDTFYVTATEKSPFATLYKGNMRGKSTEEVWFHQPTCRLNSTHHPNHSIGQVFEAVTKKLDALPGLGDRVQLFLMEDPTPLTPEEAVQQGSKPPDPVFMVISKEAVPQKATLLTAGGAAVTLAGTAFTAFAYGIGNFALRPEFYQKINDGDTSVAAMAIPIMLGVLALQAIHELGHWAMAGNKEVKIGSPIFIPSLQLGLFGAITPLLSFPKNRKQYFDVAAAGPLLGTLASLAVFVAGIVFTGMASPGPSFFAARQSSDATEVVLHFFARAFFSKGTPQPMSYAIS
eukprot:jgi/Undpi1/4456/HiC_scaffold_17.g07810.m1